MVSSWLQRSITPTVSRTCLLNVSRNLLFGVLTRWIGVLWIRCVGMRADLRAPRWRRFGRRACGLGQIWPCWAPEPAFYTLINTLTIFSLANFNSWDPSCADVVSKTAGDMCTCRKEQRGNNTTKTNTNPDESLPLYADKRPDIITIQALRSWQFAIQGEAGTVARHSQASG